MEATDERLSSQTVLGRRQIAESLIEPVFCTEVALSPVTRRLRALPNQHAIPVREEPVALLHRVPISGERVLASGER